MGIRRRAVRSAKGGQSSNRRRDSSRLRALRIEAAGRWTNHLEARSRHWEWLHTDRTLALRPRDQISDHLYIGRTQHDCSCGDSRRTPKSIVSSGDRDNPGSGTLPERGESSGIPRRCRQIPRTKVTFSVMILRRSFLSSLGASIALQPPGIPGQSPASTTWQPARHAEDDWLDRIPGKHRLVFDTTTPEGFGRALLFSNNFLDTNKNAYGLEYADVALVIVVRHLSTPFAFTDAMWSKYGQVFAQRLNFNDPKTKKRPEVNLYNASGYGTTLANSGVILDSIL